MNKLLDKYNFIPIYISLVLGILFMLGTIAHYETKNPNMEKILNLQFKEYEYKWIKEISLLHYERNINDLNIGEYEYLIKKYYIYNSYNDSLTNKLPIRNCRYWSLLHYNFFKQKGYEIKFVLSETHIVVIAFKKTHYYLLDGDNMLRINLN